MKPGKQVVRVLATAVALSGICGIAVAKPRRKPDQVALSGFLKRVILVVFENTSYRNTISQPNFRKLASEGATLSRFSAEAHPSQPNYLAMVAGDTFGKNTDDNVTVKASHIGNLLGLKGMSWMNYAEGYPGNCYLGSSRRLYARKHVPFLSFYNVQNSAEQCAHVVNASQFDADLHNGALPDFSFYTPDLNNDGHDTGVAYADRWLGAFLSKLNDAQVWDDTTLIVTFDEDEGTSVNSVYTVLYGHLVKGGSSSARSYNHYSLLKTLEEGWQLGSLGRKDASATAIQDIWSE